MKRPDLRLTALFASAWLFFAMTALAGDTTPNAAKARDSLRQLRNETLHQLYKENPKAKSQVRGAFGS